MNESLLETAVREWCEEVGLDLPPGRLDTSGVWISSNGKYQGFVYRIAKESDIDLNNRRPDPDSGKVNVVAWVHPEDMATHNLRPQLLGDLDEVLEEVATEEVE